MSNLSRLQWPGQFPPSTSRRLPAIGIDPKLERPAQTALHFTASKNHLDTARKLIAHRASARIKDKRGQLPLHRAAAIGSVPMVNFLLECKSPLNATDVSGLTALHHGELELSLPGMKIVMALILW